MKEFPINLNVKYKDSFPDIYYTRTLCYLRKSIYEHIISSDENNYFDFEEFGRKYFKDHKDRIKLTSKLIESIMLELETRGWKCKISYGGTAMFIYSTDKPPPSCWEDSM